VDVSTYADSGQSVFAELARTVATMLEAAVRERGDLRLQHVQHRAKAPAPSLRRNRSA